MTTAVKYNTREEALSAYLKMRARKQKWMEESERELKAFARRMNVTLA